MFDAVLFDMDGVLVDSEPAHLATTQVVLARRGARLDEAFYWARTGMDEVAFFADVVLHLGLRDDPETLSRERQAAYLERLAREPVLPMEGVHACLLLLRGDGRRIALASSATRAQVDTVVGRLGLGRVFEATVSIDDVAHGKPAPDLFLEAAHRLDVAPARCVVVEDAVLGVTAARAARMVAVAVPPAGDEGVRHRLEGAAAVLGSLIELTPDLLDALPGPPSVA